MSTAFFFEAVRGSADLTPFINNLDLLSAHDRGIVVDEVQRRAEIYNKIDQINALLYDVCGDLVKCDRIDLEWGQGDPDEARSRQPGDKPTTIIADIVNYISELNDDSKGDGWNAPRITIRLGKPDNKK